MSKGIGADHGLVRLHRETGDFRHKAGTIHDLGGVQGGFTGKNILACMHRHDDLLKRSITGPFPQTIDRTLHLTGPIEHR